jgi:hypothetical protein
MMAGNLNPSDTPTQAAVSQKPAKIRTTILFVAAAIVCDAIGISSRKDKPSATEAHQSNSRSAPPMTVSVVHPEGGDPKGQEAILSSMINAAGCYYPDLIAPQEKARLPPAGCLYHLSSSHHCRVRLPQVARATDYLSQTAKYILG